MYNCFWLAGYDPDLTDQSKREGDIRVANHLNRAEWIIEAKGLSPAGGDSTSLQEGLGQILMARNGRDSNIIYALAMPYDGPFPQLVTQIDDKDRACLRLHWIWVEQQFEDSHCTRFEVRIDCPPGSTCACQEQIRTFPFWIKSTNLQAEA